MRYPLVYIIIVNWNGWRDTLECIEECRKITWPNYYIVVVDNASSDGSEVFLRQKLKEADFIQSGSNLGFAGGCNIGIRQALERGADYMWLLNNDAVADPEALTILVEVMENDPTVGIAGSKIYYHNDPRKIWFAGGMWEKGRLHLRQRGAGMLEEGQFGEMCRVGSVSGCSMLVRASTVREIGLMDESYFLYWEDTGLCARAQEKGYAVFFVPASHVRHKVSTSTVNRSFDQYYYFTRNGFAFLRRHDPLRIPVFGIYNLLFGLKSLFVRNPQPLRGLLRGFMDFSRGKTGALVPAARYIASGKNTG